MKVLHINSYYSGSSFYKNLFDKQIKSEVDLDVFVPVPTSFDSSGLLLGNYTKISANHGKYDRVFFFLKHIKIYKDILKNYKINDYTIIHAHSLFSNGYIAMKLKQKYNVPYIVTVRNTDVNTFFKHMFHLRNLGLRILKEAERVIFLSDSYKQIVFKNYIPIGLRKELTDKVEIVPNGIDDFWFDNRGIPKQYHSSDDLKLLYVGVINKNKNIMTTIKAIEHLRDNGYNITFTIVGKVEDKSIFQQIKGLPFVHYFTPKQKKDLLGIYRSSDVFVMPSKTESFGLVYAEAMSQGLPVIYSKGQGFDGQFDEGLIGFHVDCQDYKDIVNKIISIHDNYEEISKRCLSMVDKFCWDEITNVLIDLYSSKR